MPRPSKGARLYLRAGKPPAGSVWVILDGKREIGTGCGAGDRRGADAALAAYITSKYQPERRERRLDEILIADVLKIYLGDVVPHRANPRAAGERAKRLLAWWGTRTLSEVTGGACRDYAAWREGQGRTNLGTGGGARRDLQDLSAAIGHHLREGLHRGNVKVVLPPKGEARQRWLTRSEAAQLLWVCWRTREVQNGNPTEKRPLRHLARFLLLGIYTGSRPGAILNASWLRGPKRSLVDLGSGVFHRLADGAIKTNKRQPTVRLAPRLMAHMRRWKRADDKAGRAHVVMFDGAPVASVKTALGRAVELAGLPGSVTAYTLRHTCASWLVAKGVSTRLIADFLGTSEAMILAHYGHLAPDYQDEAAREIGRK